MDVIMPQLGETVLEGSVAKWHKDLGATVEADEPLFDVETEKVTTEIPAPISGVLSQILVAVGVSVKVGTRLAVIESPDDTEAPPTTPSQNVTLGKVAVDPSVALDANKPASPLSVARDNSSGIRLSPVVRRLLDELGISPTQIVGTGADSRITREDVLAYARNVAEHRASAGVAHDESSRAAAPTKDKAPQEFEIVKSSDDLVIPLNSIRRRTAAHMVRSKATSPHALQAVEVDFHQVDKARKTLGIEWKAREGYSLTYLPFIARAICDAIAKFPYVNSSFGQDALIVHRAVHLGIAVDVNLDGLIATVVRDAQHRNLQGIAAEIHRLAVAARSNRLKPDEMNGGTYTLSNSGTFGTFFSTSIINQPQTAILSVDGVRKKPVVVDVGDGDVIAIRPIGVLAQSFDHRAFDGAYSASFLKCLKDVLENRNWLAELC